MNKRQKKKMKQGNEIRKARQLARLDRIVREMDCLCDAILDEHAARKFAEAQLVRQAEDLFKGPLYQFDDVWHDACIAIPDSGNRRAMRDLEIAFIDVHHQKKISFGLTKKAV